MGLDCFPGPVAKSNADTYGLARDRFTPISFDTGKLTTQEFSNLTGGAPLRFMHIDGDETDLMESFKAEYLTIGGDAMGHVCVMLTPDPGLADVRDDIAAGDAKHRGVSSRNSTPLALAAQVRRNSG